MSLDAEAESAVKSVATAPPIAPATFRGVDCAVLAERYVAYRRSSGLDARHEDPDVIRPAPASQS